MNGSKARKIDKRELQRFMIGFLLPGPLGVTILFTFALANSSVKEGWTDATPIFSSPLSFLGGFASMMLFSYIFFGIQSFAYSYLMEYMVNKRVRGDLRAIACSVALGTMAALLGPWGTMGTPFVVIGATVGLIVGLILRRLYKSTANQAL